jgi:PIN domain nuclease of toxin-antitoxin system
MKIVLDASALLAYLHQEQGKEQIDCYGGVSVRGEL